MPSKLRASAAQDMTRWKGGVPGTMMLTMKVKGALLALHAQNLPHVPFRHSATNAPADASGYLPILLSFL